MCLPLFPVQGRQQLQELVAADTHLRVFVALLCTPPCQGLGPWQAFLPLLHFQERQQLQERVATNKVAPGSTLLLQARNMHS